MRAYLLTRARHGDDELFVLLSDEIFRTAAGAAVGVLFLDFNEELFGWLQCQANLAGWPVHWRRGLFHVFRRKINKLNLGDFLSGFPRLHHLVKLEGRWVRALCVKE